VKEHASGACYHDRGQEPASIYPDAHRLASFSDALVEQGEIAIELDGIEHRVRRGGLVVVPRGVAFRWRNASRERGVRWVATYTPGGFERFFLEMADRLRMLASSDAFRYDSNRAAVVDAVRR
jgi:hypothetical protein